MKNVIILVMSTFRDVVKQTAVKSDIGEFKTIHTNETSVRYIEKSLPEKQRINRVYVLTTEAVKKQIKDTIRNPRSNIPENIRDLTHFECFKKLINCKEEFYPKELDAENSNEAKNYYKQFKKAEEKVRYPITNIDLDESPKAFINCLYRIIQQLKEDNFDKEQTNIYIDTTGGFRYTMMIMQSLSRLLSYNGYNHSKMIYSKLDMDKDLITVEDITSLNELFTLVGGAEDFAMFGNTTQLNNFFGDSDNKVFKEVLRAMENFSEAIKRCVYYDYMLDCLFDLKNSIIQFKKKYANQRKKNNVESAFDMLLPRIEEEYKSILPTEESLQNIPKNNRYKYVPAIINWCCDKNFVQQALTFYVEWIPMYLLKQKITLTNKRIKSECENSKLDYDPWEKQFFKSSYSLEYKSIKSPYDEEDYLEIVRGYKKLIEERNTINHANSSEDINWYSYQNSVLLSKIQDNLKRIG